MSRTKKNAKATKAVARRAWLRARQTAKDAKPVAAQVKPLANDTKAATSRGLRKAQAWAAPQVERTGQVIQDTVAPAARRGLRRARVWAAPQVDRTGQVIQDTVAPKVAAALHSSAQRLDPGKPKRHTWRKLAGISALLAAAGAVVAAVRSRTAPGTPTQAEEDEPAPVSTTAAADGAANEPAHTP
jgi:hypothetical protein